MATAEAATRPHDRHTRKRGLATWVKRLANLKNSSSDTPNTSSKKQNGSSPSKSKKAAAKNNPYPESGQFNGSHNGHLSFSSPISQTNGSFTSIEDQDSGHHRTMAKSTKSTAPTVATNPETVHSEAGHSKAGTSTMVGGGNSTFSSPNHSERSLTTTLTTIQSTAPSAMLAHQNAGHASSTAPNGSPVHFSHQFPTSPPPSAIPSHLAPQPNPQTYQAATANNILTDNASILTLASSSKRRRRHSLDTDASVRALAPSSVWGGSRESLPLSVLSGNPDTIYSPQNRPGVGLASAERASVYSSSGVAAPILSSERNSYYAKTGAVDTGSIRSGRLGHGRTDSITGSIGAPAASPLASPREAVPPGRLSRRSSDWKGAEEGSENDENGEASAVPMAEDVEGKGKAPAA